MLKKDLIKEAQKHCDSSFTSTDPNSHYSAWNSMSSLIKKNLVFKENKLPARYKLTEEGRNLAQTILNVTNENSENSDDTTSPPPKSDSISKKNQPTIEMEYESDQDSSPVNDKVEKSVLKSATILATGKTKNDVIEILSDSDCDIITIDDERPKEISTVSKLSKANSKEAKKPVISSDSDSDSLPDIDFGKKSNYSKELSPGPTFRAKNSSISSHQQRPTNSITNKSSQQKPSTSSVLSQGLGSMQTSSSEKFSQKTFLKKTNSQAPSSMYSFEPGSFDVMLYVDNCEQSHA